MVGSMAPTMASVRTILEVEDVRKLSVITVGPKVTPIRCINRLGHDPKPVPSRTDTSSITVTHTKFTADVSNINRLSLVGEGQVPGDHEEERTRGRSGCDLTAVVFDLIVCALNVSSVVSMLVMAG